jgi:putative transposase
MWTKEHRQRAAAIAKKVKRYPSDLTDAEWQAIAPLLPPPAATGRRRHANLREMINAIRYLVRSGCGWRMLPIHFGPWQTVYWWFRRLVRRFLFRLIHDIALMVDRFMAKRHCEPTAAILDSQSVKAPHAAHRGYDAGKKITGRKRHIAVDTDGRLLMINVTPADMADAAGALAVLEAIRKRWPWIKHLFADGAYDRLMLMDKAAVLDFIVEIVRKLDAQQGFVPLPKRWVVERTFAWMMPWRRLVRDYEKRIDVSESMVYVAMGGLLLKRIFD